jgi:hypothetical protein
VAVAIEIPAPRPGDSAQVVTSLENAALFGRIGDSEEALRWLQRAAESAGESGDDERTLVLARMASELSSSLRPISGTTPLNGERRLPTPPPRSRPVEATPARPVEIPSARSEAPAARPAEALSNGATPARPVEARPSEATPARPVATASAQPAEAAPSRPSEETALRPDEVAPRSRSPADTGATDEPTLLLTRPALHKTSRPPAPAAASVAPRPPPPSSRPQTARPPQLSSHQLPSPSQLPIAGASTAPKPPAAFTADAHTPSSVTPVSPTSVGSHAPAPAALAPAPSHAPAPASHAPAPASVAPPSTSAPTSAVWRPARVRQAARVSVEKSKTEPGLYLVRILDEGKSPEAGRSEALLVSIDPGVGLF